MVFSPWPCISLKDKLSNLENDFEGGRAGGNGWCNYVIFSRLHSYSVYYVLCPAMVLRCLLGYQIDALSYISTSHFTILFLVFFQFNCCSAFTSPIISSSSSVVHSLFNSFLSLSLLSPLLFFFFAFFILSLSIFLASSLYKEQVGTKRKAGSPSGSGKKKQKTGRGSQDSDWNEKEEKEKKKKRGSGREGGRPFSPPVFIHANVTHEQARHRVCIVCLKYKGRQARGVLLGENRIDLGNLLFYLNMQYSTLDPRLPVFLCTGCRSSLRRCVAAESDTMPLVNANALRRLNLIQPRRRFRNFVCPGVSECSLCSLTVYTNVFDDRHRARLDRAVEHSPSLVESEPSKCVYTYCLFSL